MQTKIINSIVTHPDGSRTVSSREVGEDEANPSAIPPAETGNVTLKAAQWEVGPLAVSGAGGIPCRDVLIVGVDRFSGGYVCNAVDGIAQSIVRDHNSHDVLVAALQLLRRHTLEHFSAVHHNHGSKDMARALDAADAALVEAGQ